MFHYVFPKIFNEVELDVDENGEESFTDSSGNRVAVVNATYEEIEGDDTTETGKRVQWNEQIGQTEDPSFSFYGHAEQSQRYGISGFEDVSQQNSNGVGYKEDELIKPGYDGHNYEYNQHSPLQNFQQVDTTEPFEYLNSCSSTNIYNAAHETFEIDGGNEPNLPTNLIQSNFDSVNLDDTLPLEDPPGLDKMNETEVASLTLQDGEEAWKHDNPIIEENVSSPESEYIPSPSPERTTLHSAPSAAVQAGDSGIFMNPLKNTFAMIKGLTSRKNKYPDTVELQKELHASLSSGLSFQSPGRLEELDKEVAKVWDSMSKSGESSRIQVTSDCVSQLRQVLDEGLENQTWQSLEHMDRAAKQACLNIQVFEATPSSSVHDSKALSKETGETRKSRTDYVASMLGMQPLPEEEGEPIYRSIDLERREKEIEQAWVAIKSREQALEESKSRAKSQEQSASELKEALERKQVEFLDVERRLKERGDMLRIEENRFTEARERHEEEVARLSELEKHLNSFHRELENRDKEISSRSTEKVEEMRLRTNESVKELEAKLLQVETELTQVRAEKDEISKALQISQRKVEEQEWSIENISKISLENSMEKERRGRAERECSVLRERVWTDEYRRVLEIAAKTAVEELGSILQQSSEDFSQINSFIAELVHPIASMDGKHLNLAVMQQAVIGILRDKLRVIQRSEEVLRLRLDAQYPILSFNDKRSSSPVWECVHELSKHFELRLSGHVVEGLGDFSLEDIAVLKQQILDLKSPSLNDRVNQLGYLEELERSISLADLENLSKESKEQQSGEGNLCSGGVGFEKHRLRSLQKLVGLCANEIASWKVAIHELNEKLSSVSLSALDLCAAFICSSSNLGNTTEKAQHDEKVQGNSLDQTIGQFRERSLLGCSSPQEISTKSENKVISKENQVISQEPMAHASTQTVESLESLCRDCHRCNSGTESEGTEKAPILEDLVVKKLAASVVATCIERNCRHDCLEVVASVLDFSPDEKRRVGLIQESSGFWNNILPDWSRSQVRAEALNSGQKSFSDLFSDFVEDEIS